MKINLMKRDMNCIVIQVERVIVQNYDSTDLDLICSTFDDKSNTLKGKCDELFKSVKLHESDFVISETAKSLIDRYLNPKKNNASDGFMNIPDGIDEELPFN